MSLLTLPLRLPLLPFTTLVRLAEVIEEEAGRQFEAEVRRELEEAEEARLTGQATAEEIAHLEEEALQRITGWRASADVPRGVTRPPEEQAPDG